jgi:hypothetical protein
MNYCFLYKLHVIYTETVCSGSLQQLLVLKGYFYTFYAQCYDYAYLELLFPSTSNGAPSNVQCKKTSIQQACLKAIKVIEVSIQQQTRHNVSKTFLTNSRLLQFKVSFVEH